MFTFITNLVIYKNMDKGFLPKTENVSDASKDPEIITQEITTRLARLAASRLAALGLASEFDINVIAHKTNNTEEVVPYRNPNFGTGSTNYAPYNYELRLSRKKRGAQERAQSKTFWHLDTLDDVELFKSRIEKEIDDMLDKANGGSGIKEDWEREMDFREGR